MKRCGVDDVRVIAGRWKGCRLMAPNGVVARPTTDRVKESMFNLLGLHWQGGVVLDLFAGSGALGIEAVSRGAEGAVFVDTDARSLAAIRDNLERCGRSEASLSGLAAICKVWRMDWRQAVSKVAKEYAEIGWVFLDPPYGLNLWEPVMRHIAASGMTVVHGVVCEHPVRTELPQLVAGFGVWKQKHYGDISVTIYRSRGDL